jgi:hypothetical protein
LTWLPSSDPERDKHEHHKLMKLACLSDKAMRLPAFICIYRDDVNPDGYVASACVG